MKRINVLLFTLLLATLAFADKVTEKQAYAIAQQFAASHGFTASAKKAHIAERRAAKGARPSATADYYVVNMDGEGFVIVSGDNRVGPVLGYSTDGNYNPSNVPDGLRWMLDTYARNIETLGSSAKQSPTEKRPAIPYLIQTKWSQHNPYNLLCPKDEDGRGMPTGCVATAMAQVLYYWRSPADGTPEIPAYDHFDTKFEALPPTTFNWDDMHLTYEYNDSSQSGMEVAKLMKYCGQSVEMCYDPGGSSAYLDPKALISYFGFSAETTELYRSNFTTSQWENFVYDELSAGRPVLYSGQSLTGGGHQFICDGYDGDGFFHINMGWGGSSNGYYSLSALSSRNYNAQQSIIYKAQPRQEGEEHNLAVCYSYFYGDTITTRESESHSFYISASVHFLFRNYSNTDTLFDVRLSVYQGDKLIGSGPAHQGVIKKNDSEYLHFGLGGSKVLASLNDGVYRIVPESRVHAAADTTFTPCLLNEIYYIEVSVSGDTLRLTPMPKDIGEGKYSISDFKIEGRPKQGRENKAVFKLSNTGKGGSEERLYVYAGDNRIGANAFYCEPGETVDACIPVTLYGLGSTKITVKDERDTVLYTQDYTIMPYTKASLDGKLTLGIPEKHASGRITLPFNLTVTNKLDTGYDDDIRLMLYKGDEDESSLDTLINAKIAANGTAEIPIRIDNLDLSYGHYSISLYYYSEDRTMYLESMRFILDRAFFDAKVQDYGAVNHAPEKITATITNKGFRDYEDKALLRVYKYEKGDKYGWVYDTDTINVRARVDSSLTVTKALDLFNLRDSADYVVTMDYKEPGSERYNVSLNLAKFTVLPGREQKIEVEKLGKQRFLDKIVRLKCKNVGENDYDNAIQLQVYLNGERLYRGINPVSIPTGDSVVVSYELPEFSKAGSYYLYVYYISKNQMKQADWFTMDKSDLSEYEISNARLEEPVRKGRNCKLRFNVTNKIPKKAYPQYRIALNDSTISNSFFWLDSCETIEFVQNFTPIATGPTTISLLNGNTWFADTLFTETVDVKEATAAKLTGNFIMKSVEKGDNGKLRIDMAIRVTNELDTDFYDALYINAGGYDEEGYWNRIKDSTHIVHIPAHKTVILPLAYDELNPAIKSFVFEAQYYDMVTEHRLSRSVTSQSVAILSPSTDDLGNLSQTPQKINVTITNKGLGGYDSSFRIVLCKVNDDGSYTVCLTDRHYVKDLPAGSDMTFEVNLGGTRFEDGVYVVRVIYYTAGAERESEAKPAFSIGEVTGIDNANVDGNSQVRVYDLAGRFVGTMNRDELRSRLTKGIYIVDGRKIVIR